VHRPGSVLDFDPDSPRREASKSSQAQRLASKTSPLTPEMISNAVPRTSERQSGHQSGSLYTPRPPVTPVSRQSSGSIKSPLRTPGSVSSPLKSRSLPPRGRCRCCGRCWSLSESLQYSILSRALSLLSLSSLIAHTNALPHTPSPLRTLADSHAMYIFPQPWTTTTRSNQFLSIWVVQCSTRLSTPFFPIARPISKTARDREEEREKEETERRRGRKKERERSDRAEKVTHAQSQGEATDSRPHRAVVTPPPPPPTPCMCPPTRRLEQVQPARCWWGCVSKEERRAKGGSSQRQCMPRRSKMQMLKVSPMNLQSRLGAPASISSAQCRCDVRLLLSLSSSIVQCASLSLSLSRVRARAVSIFVRESELWRIEYIST
jgi:hypothetical protein